MSETAATLPPPPGEPVRPQSPTVYFIDDSATMREVVKIAFRRESINVVTCPDAASALAQFEETPPDAVITDVIMPDKDGYEVCRHIKQHPKLGTTPVILMSGVVNKTVADKAISVRADELIRKPFQPQELISRVKGLLHPKAAPPAEPQKQPVAAGPPSAAFKTPVPPPPAQTPAPSAPSESVWPRALVEALLPRPTAPPTPVAAAPAAPPPRPAASAADIQRLKTEIMRLELLVKKLQTELAVERQYCQALEAQIKALQDLQGT
jgi:CheY-like chemotaxis protein